MGSKVYDLAIETPLQPAPVLSTRLNNRILFKREDLQPVFSFKIRGAYNKIASLSSQDKEQGIVCCSAGNHAQGVALSANQLKIDAKIVMPTATPAIKVRSVRQHGGKYVSVILHGKNYDEAAAESKRLQKEENRTMILPFDDPLVIAGQGTIGMEILQQTTGETLDAIFVCCGGGGMLAGVAAWVKQFRPSVKVIGVEASDAAGMTESLKAGQVVELDQVGLFADGAAVRRVGDETFRLCKDHVDEMVTVNTDEICAAIKAGFNDTRIILEPAGALAIAGVRKYINQTGVTGSTFVATLSGANTDFDRLRFVSERADESETLISVVIDETPGAFNRLYDTLDQARVVVTEFSYRFSDTERASIFLSFQAHSPERKGDALQSLRDQQYDVMDLTSNELAKTHSRYLAGGKSPMVGEEVVYRFEFLDRPDALRELLHRIHAEWNISLFHYRNYGADIGRVLVGFQVPPADRNRFETEFLPNVGMTWFDETENPTYGEFLLR